MTTNGEDKRDELEEGREEVGDSVSSARHPPHTPANASDDSIQAESDSDEEIPVLPANASGKDRVSTNEQAQPIDEGSMYDRRPAEDKNRPPSKE